MNLTNALPCGQDAMVEATENHAREQDVNEEIKKSIVTISLIRRKGKFLGHNRLVKVVSELKGYVTRWTASGHG